MKVAIEKRFREKVFATTIVSAAKIQEAETLKKTVFQVDRQSTGARDFMELGREVLTRLRLEPLRVQGAEGEEQAVEHPTGVGDEVGEATHGAAR
jgi:nitrogenase subunit NifH